jgi:hypothetical protein
LIFAFSHGQIIGENTMEQVKNWCESGQVIRAIGLPNWKPFLFAVTLR